ncbi:hypothetical protein [Brumimicrobium oceani]|uniref:Uncharacterized protein n=1 Tax=Brumimicrobium oceani TaxID=2100725 RepID=A0A2U2XDN0_9FLAO|nr:hypothetical protein [Brumimicrobium oceani]PWH85867.1 hypothetical protein DIT68_07170 [Brumimicrobium oceani]
MNNSIEDVVRIARENALEDFKFRFMQKWYEATPCFHWKELKLSPELKTEVGNEVPSVYFFIDDGKELDLDDKVWEKGELHKVISFEWMSEEISEIEDDQRVEWFRNSIATALQKTNDAQTDLIMVYNEGGLVFSKEWRYYFEKQLHF